MHRCASGKNREKQYSLHHDKTPLEASWVMCVIFIRDTGMLPKQTKLLKKRQIHTYTYTYTPLCQHCLCLDSWSGLYTTYRRSQ